MNGFLISNTFESSLFPVASLVPVIDISLLHNASILAITNTSSSLMFKFFSPPSDPLLCAFWSTDSHSWATTGITSSILSDDTLACHTTHFTPFSVIVHPNGLSFLSSTDSSTFLFSMLGVLLSVILLAAITDLFCRS